MPRQVLAGLILPSRHRLMLNPAGVRREKHHAPGTWWGSSTLGGQGMGAGRAGVLPAGVSPLAATVAVAGYRRPSLGCPSWLVCLAFGWILALAWGKIWAWGRL